MTGPEPMGSDTTESEYSDSIAVIGMAGRFPESPTIAEFWENLRAGRDCLRRFSESELEELGIPAEIYKQPNFVPRGTVLPDMSGFDAGFFGFSPRQAATIDPQSRIFLESCYQAMEHAGYDPEASGGTVGVFAGSNPNDYALLLGVADPTDSLGAFDQMIGTDRDFIATRAAHCLGLTGPAMTIQTACSTSLVTVHAACQALLAYECSMALAGGVSVNLRQGVGYFYQQGMILSPTGECRAFDADAAGTTLGQGCGVVVLKRLDEAVADNDNILAVVRATAINNDGGAKISYTAPSEDGQAAVIATALELAGVESDTIGYVETHGTGTLLGDPVEIAALTRAFRAGTDRRQYCAIGSAKTNFGHTDAAAGITGFMKAVLSLHHREVPPSIHFETPNPAIGFESTPFFVNDRLRPWPAGPTPRRAGVSAFGIGGTNAHAVLEEAPVADRITAPARRRVLLLSAKSEAAADRRVTDLADALQETEAAVADVAYTLQRGRAMFDRRRAVVADDGQDLPAILRGEGGRLVRGVATSPAPDLVWMFSGQGSQHPGMAKGLYEQEPVFAAAIDRVADVVRHRSGLDILEPILQPATDGVGERLRQTAVTQPTLFAVEHAMACLLRSWGLAPRAVVGHSIGEFAAGVEAGIFGWEDAAELVVDRGALMQSMEPGRMLSVAMPASDLVALLPAGLGLAGDNAPGHAVASGPSALVEEFGRRLAEDGYSATVLQTSHAFHSPMMGEAADKFEARVSEASLMAPSLPMISNVTGRPITEAEATAPSFWSDQIRNPILFRQCVTEAAELGPAVFLELGPGRVLTGLVANNDDVDGVSFSLPTMRHPRQDRDDHVVLLEAMASLWAAGVDIDWDRVVRPSEGRRIPLPTYPFDRVETWLPPHRHVLALPRFGPPPSADIAAEAIPTGRRPLDNWLYVPSWQRASRPDNAIDRSETTVVLAPDTAGGAAMVAALADGGDTIVVRPGAAFARQGRHFLVDPTSDDDLAAVFAAIHDEGTAVGTVVHAWLADGSDGHDGPDDLEQSLTMGVHSILAVAKGLGPITRDNPVHLDVVTAEAFSVLGQEAVRPAAAAAIGPTRVIPLEYSRVTTRMIDLQTGLGHGADLAALVAELCSSPPTDGADAVVALRTGQRWTPTTTARPTTSDHGSGPFRNGGRYLIIGGLGGVGLSIGRHLATEYKANLVLTSRGGRPEVSDDPEGERRLDLLAEIEELAATVDVVAADASDGSSMTALFDRIDQRLGGLEGVIVAAGVADQAGAIHRRSRQVMNESIKSKVHGLVILEQHLTERAVDFVVLSSSIATVLYHNRFAQVGYVTGNAFAEATAVRFRRLGIPALTIAWDDWLDVGMSVRSAQDFSAEFGQDVELMDRLHSFSPDEGVELLERALGTDEPVVVASTTDLSRRAAQDINVTSPFLEQATEDGEPVAVAVGATLADTVRSVWSSLLGFDSFGQHDDFFDLGGDSLQAARMADRLGRALGRDVPIDMVFETPTVAGMVDGLEELGNAEPEPEPVRRERPITPRPLGPGQQRFIDRGSETSDHFNTSVLLRPSRPLVRADLETALAALLENHEALRLRFQPSASGGPVQQIAAGPAHQSVDVIDLQNQPADRIPDELEMAADLAQRSLDLEHGPILKLVLVHLPDQEQRLLLVVHHLMCDRVSLLLMMDTLSALLTEPAADGGRGLGAVSFLDWVDAMVDVAKRADAAELDRYRNDQRWDRVAPLPCLDHADRAENRNHTVEAVIRRLDGSQLAGQTDRLSAKLDELVLLALVNGLTAWTDAEAALVDVLGHGRRLPLGLDVSRSVGMFITYTPVLAGDADPGKNLVSLRDDLEHGWTFDVLRYYGPAAVRHRLQSLPRADVLFNFVGREIAAETGALLTPTDEPRGSESDETGRRDHAIAVRAETLADGDIELRFVFSNRLQDRAMIEELADLVSTDSVLTGGQDGERAG